jgi:hypothetical protein
MTDKNDDKQPSADNQDVQADVSERDTNDLRSAAEEALQMFHQAQDDKQQLTRVDLHKDDVIAAQNQQKSGDDAEADDAPEADTDADASDSDKSPEKPMEIGNTTHDLAKAAYEAMHRAQAEADDEETTASAPVAEPDPRLDFPPEMALCLDVTDTATTLVLDVTGEMIVGRADNVTDYTPNVDLTPHGAYRLGLSRRHAALMREDNRLKVKDLQSRNGTFINDIKMEKGSIAPIRDGDDVRFGNLTVRVSFQLKSDS